MSKSLLFCLIIGLAYANSEETVDEANVLVLTKSNFNQTITGYKYILVAFCK